MALWTGETLPCVVLRFVKKGEISIGILWNLSIVFSVNGARMFFTAQNACTYSGRGGIFLGEGMPAFMECFLLYPYPAEVKKKGRANICLLPACLRLGNPGG